MAVERHHTLAHRIEAWAFHAYWNRFARMDLDAASNAGSRFARRFGPLTPAHVTARNNLRMVFPGLSNSEEREILDAMWDNLGRLTGEFPHVGAMGVYAPGSRITVEGTDILDRYREPGEGAIFVSGHFANWEVMAAAIVHRGIDCRITYRQANNPWIDDTIVKARADYGVTLFAPKGKEGGMSLMRILAKGGSVAIMNDQKFNTGVNVPFLGHACMTADGPARLAIRFGRPIQPISVHRDGGAHFTVTFADPITPSADPDPETRVRETVMAINAFLEARVRAAPEQWFWVHRRWPKEAWKAAGVV
jgi:Kdo2-lipid IVA lauroyltransferase/acyltransferase